MLGKQGWRLLTRPDSLCARVLKGRYYHDRGFSWMPRRRNVLALLGALSWQGGKVLRQGLVKRIGDGTSTRIWGDRWIPNHFGGRPLTPSDGQQVSHVSDLIIASGSWNVENFFDVDVHAILKLQVCGRGDDLWAWESEKHGNYSVKSAYRLMEDGRNTGRSESVASGSAAVEWKQTWKLDVPPKVRVFWWRVLHGYLSVKQVLHHRHVERLPNCDTCGADKETIRHVLIECTVARMFWSQTKDLFGVKLPKLRHDSWARDLLSDCVLREESAGDRMRHVGALDTQEQTAPW